MIDEATRGILQGAFLAFAALFPVVNPLGMAPVFLTLTDSLTSAERRLLAGKVAVNGFALLLGSLFLGDLVLGFFGVSIPVVQVAGGLIVATVGWNLLQAPDEEHERRDSMGYAVLESKTLYPLTLPLTVGPGSIAVAITIGANFPSTPQPFVADAAATGIGMALVALSIYACLGYADVVGRKLGRRGLAVVMRLSAFILLCIGVQIVWNGVDALFGISARIGHP